MFEEKVSKVLATYYVNSNSGYTFMCPKLDKDGKPILKLNPLTGQPNYIGNEPEYLKERIDFKFGTYTPGELCYSYYEVTESTPKNISAALAKMAASRTDEVMDEDTFIRTRNPERFEEIKIRRALEDQNKDLEKKVFEAKAEADRIKAESERKERENGDTIAKMKAKLAEMESKIAKRGADNK